MIEKIKGKDHLIIKRDGRTEKFSKKKLYNWLIWACDGSEILAKELLDAIEIKIYNKIHITKLMDVAIQTASNKTSEMFPIWDRVAANMYRQKMYKETWSIKRDEYPSYDVVIKKGVQYSIYDKDIIESFDDDEILELGDYIKQERDCHISYLGLKNFYNRNCLKYTKTKVLELPQHVHMRVAIYAFWKEPKEERIQLIKDRYDYLSLGIITEATPKVTQSLKSKAQMSSCVIMRAEDSAESINAVSNAIGIYSKYGGGVAWDDTSIRSYNSRIGKHGVSSGKVPFIKMWESSVSAYNQQGIRNGAGINTSTWWDIDIFDILQLKEEGGSEENRARKLKYSIKLNELLFEKVRNKEDIYLFSPSDTPELVTAYGKEFNDLYEKYSNQSNLRKIKVSAIKLMEEIIKQRAETGNIYIFFDENVNEQGMFKDYIYSSNLCQEVCLPTKGLSVGDSDVNINLDDKLTKVTINDEVGEIALCNLSSINSYAWSILTCEEKENISYNLLRASDNLIDYAYYPIKEGEISNKLRRSIGVGQSNYAYYLARNNIDPNSEEAKRYTYQLSEDIAYNFTKASIRLARERGVPKWFNKTYYSEGLLPMDLNKISEEYKHYSILDWENVKEDLIKYGMRFSALFATAPTASSSLGLAYIDEDGEWVTGATEGIDFPRKLVSLKVDNNLSEAQIVPGLLKYKRSYKLAWDVGNKTIIELGAIRQIFSDQSQSLSLVSTEQSHMNCMSEHLRDLVLAYKRGVKTLYYHHTKDASSDEEECINCAS